jgi:hypothetical protein
LASARVLSAVSDEIAGVLGERGSPDSFEAAQAILLSADHLGTLMSVAEAPSAVFRRHRSAPRSIRIPLDAFLRDWISGVEMGELADRYLAEVADRQFRLEQAADFTTAAFENHLPWAYGAVIDWAVESSPEAESEHVRFVPAAIRYGVNATDAAQMLRRGLQSRSLAVAVAAAHRAAGVEVGVREWLAALDIGTWTATFGATPADLRDLLDFARRPGTRLLADLLEGDDISVPIATTGTIADGTQLKRLVAEDQPTPVVQVWSDTIIGWIPVEFHSDVVTLVATRLPLAGETKNAPEGVVLVLRLANLVDDRAETVESGTGL